MKDVAQGKLTDIQKQLPWTVKYSRDFRANPEKHKDFSHALTHTTKASGKIAAFIDDYDHTRNSEKNVRNQVADLVICAMRMANTYPDGRFDLYNAVIHRLETKNSVKLKK